MTPQTSQITAVAPITTYTALLTVSAIVAAETHRGHLQYIGNRFQRVYVLSADALSGHETYRQCFHGVQQHLAEAVALLARGLCRERALVQLQIQLAVPRTQWTIRILRFLRGQSQKK